ncbi:MAG TPA: hypothetical protein VFA04_12925 [Bryobacteraceae bacterium]|jgi:hypothetical protein|nr:hypothetical protein [Bryobacteraceae bacterium]
MEDLRVPIGSFFVILGILMLIAAGLARGNAPLAPPNVNLWCGAANLVFGGIMLWLARRAA